MKILEINICVSFEFCPLEKNMWNLPCMTPIKYKAF